MLRVMIVDDDRNTIKTLRNIIQWNHLGLLLVAEADNGEEGYEKFQRCSPDIVITDVKMPVVGGIQLLEKISKEQPKCKTILVSAYSDFKYVQEGLKLGARNYILKPIDEKELNQTLRKVVEEIDIEKEHNRIIEENRERYAKAVLLNYMLNGCINTNNDLVRTKDLFDFDDYRMMMIKTDNETITDYNQSFCMGDVQKMTIEDFLASDDKEGKLYKVVDVNEDTYILLCSGVSTNKCVQLSMQLKERLQRELLVEAHIYFTDTLKGSESLPFGYHKLQLLSTYHFYQGEKVQGYEYNMNIKEVLEICNKAIIHEITFALRHGNLHLLQRALNELMKNATLLEDKQEACAMLETMCDKILKDVDKENGNQDFFELRKSIKEHRNSFVLLQQSILTNFTKYMKKQFQTDGKQYSSVVEESILYLNSHFKEDLSLEEICKEIGVSKNYFCYLFKREVGISVWSYLTNLKLKKAKELLECTELKGYEIAFYVGFDNPSYFSKTFKKYEKMTPQEYRVLARGNSDSKA